MTQAVSTSITRRSVVAGLTLTAASAAVLAGTDNAFAQAKQTMPEESLYSMSHIDVDLRKKTCSNSKCYLRVREDARCGRSGWAGVFAIAAVVDYFSDAVVKNSTVGQKFKNPRRENGTPRTWEGYPA